MRSAQQIKRVFFISEGLVRFKFCSKIVDQGSLPPSKTPVASSLEAKPASSLHLFRVLPRIKDIGDLNQVAFQSINDFVMIFDDPSMRLTQVLEVYFLLAQVGIC